MTGPICRWGILGTANIARKNWQAIRNAGNSTLVAVASRDSSRARHFIEECQSSVPLTPAPEPCGTYQELIDRKDVDALYIPLPTGIRKEWVIRAAEAGKHILCEKPCAINADDLRAMIDACRKHRVQFMDGVMFMHSARLPLLREALNDGRSIGNVLHINSQFTFKGPDDFLAKNIRASSVLEPLGCLGDLGWYNARFSLWIMNEQLPERVSGRLLVGHDAGDGRPPVPLEFSGEMLFPGGASASFFSSFRAGNSQWAIVTGTHGYLQVHDFVVPFYGCESGIDMNSPLFRIRGCDFNMESHPRRLAAHEYSSGAETSQETNMIRTFAKIVLSGQLDPGWGDRALATQQVLDACLRSAQEDGRTVTLTR